MTTRNPWAGAILRVGDGRGFVIEVDGTRYVITAAHCLPSFPPCLSFAHAHETAYKNLIGPLGQEPHVWADCHFVDPIADIAVLGPLDNQAMPDEAETWDQLIDNAGVLPISDLAEDAIVRLLFLDGEWHKADAMHRGGKGGIWLTDAAADFQGGMSGSPIMTVDGSACGVFVVSSGDDAK